MNTAEEPVTAVEELGLPAKTAALYELTRRALLPSGLWGLFYARRTAHALEFGGFAIPPLALPLEHHFAVNGVEAQNVEGQADVAIEELALRFGLPEPYARFGFQCSVPLVQLGNPERFQIQYRNRRGVVLNEFHDWSVPAQTAPLADTSQRVRVSATADASMFDVMGYSASCTLQLALQRYFGKAISDCHRILDWGCGCGRVARFLTAKYPGKLSGIDIDRENVNWCSANLTGGEFHLCELHPPTVLPNESFDLLYGISVLTHLGEEDQFAWLTELKRIAAPGAAILLSVHGNIAFCRSDSDVHRFLSLNRNGFLDYGRCGDLDEALPEVRASNYYKNVFHTQRYICERWSDYFEIVAILEAAIGAHQDLVVMRRR